MGVTHVRCLDMQQKDLPHLWAHIWSLKPFQSSDLLTSENYWTSSETGEDRTFRTLKTYKIIKKLIRKRTESEERQHQQVLSPCLYFNLGGDIQTHLLFIRIIFNLALWFKGSCKINIIYMDNINTLMVLETCDWTIC